MGEKYSRNYVFKNIQERCTINSITFKGTNIRDNFVSGWVGLGLIYKNWKIVTTSTDSLDWGGGYPFFGGFGAIQVLRNADGGGGCLIFWKKRYEGVMFNVISITRGWVGVQFQEK